MKHRFFSILMGCIILASAVIGICIWRWDIFFGCTTENAYSLSPSPQSLMITMGENGMSDRTFTWTTGSADSCRFQLLNLNTGKEDTSLVSAGRLVQTMGGEQYMHVVRLKGLKSGRYRVVVSSTLVSSPFCIDPADSHDALRFIILGDLLLANDTLDITAAAEEKIATATRLSRILKEAEQPTAVLYTGNILHESTEQTYDVWLRAIQDMPFLTPQIAVPGSRDYDRGIGRIIDPRWPFRFALPLNGPDRFLGTTAYIDFPLCRLILLDTETLEWLVDYTVLQTWLSRTLQEAGERWKIVVMHHSVHSASAGFDHPRLHAALHPTLDNADLIISGNDLTYGRRADISLSDLINEQHTVPVYVVLTSDSSEAAVPKCSPLDHRIGSNRAFYSALEIHESELCFKTQYFAYPDSIYDAFTIDKTTKIVSEQPGLPEEVIELPARHADSGLRARRFEQLKNARQSR